MVSINRRRLIGGTVAGAASTAFSMPAVIRAQEDTVEIDFYHIWGTPSGQQEPDLAHPSVRIIDAFNESQSAVKVNSFTVGGYPDTFQAAQAEMAAGNTPALVITPWAYLNTAQGLGIQDLSSVYGEDLNALLDILNPTVTELVTGEDGIIYGVPYAFSTCTYYYNIEVLERAGVDPVESFATWEALAEAAPAIQEALDGGPVFGFGVNADFVAQSLIQSNGGDILVDGVPAMNSPEAQEAMQFITDLSSQGFRDQTPGEVRSNWQAGVSAFMQASPASLGGLRESTPFEFGTLKFPAFEGVDRLTTSGGSFIGMYAQDPVQQEAALEFLKFALSEEAYAIWMETGYLNITNHDLPILDGQEAAYEHLEEGVTAEINWPSDRGVEALTTWATYCERIWSSDISVEEGTEQAVEELSMIIGV